MNVAWECDMSGNDKLVLLALADWANEDGVCWPSISKLCFKTRASERTVQSIIRRLVEDGQVTREERPGHGSLYKVHPRNSCTPADSAPPQDLPPTPAKVAPNTFKKHQNPPLPPLRAERGQARKGKGISQPREPICKDMDGECALAAAFRERALNTIGEGVYRNLIQPCEVVSVGSGLLLRAPSEMLCEVLLRRQHELSALAKSAGFTGFRIEAVPKGNRLPVRQSPSSPSRQSGGWQ